MRASIPIILALVPIGVMLSQQPGDCSPGTEDKGKSLSSNSAQVKGAAESKEQNAEQDFKLAQKYQKKKKYDKAIEHLNSALQKVERKSDSETHKIKKFQILAELARISVKQKDFTGAEHYIQRANSEEKAGKKEKAKLNLWMGDIFYRKSEKEKALTYYKIATKTYPKIKSSREIDKFTREILKRYLIPESEMNQNRKDTDHLSMV